MLCLSLNLSLVTQTHSHTHLMCNGLEEAGKNKRHPNLIFRRNSFLPFSFLLLSLSLVYLFPFIEDKKRRRIDEERLSIVGRSRKPTPLPTRGKRRRKKQDLDNISHPHPLFVTAFLRSQVRKGIEGERGEWKRERERDREGRGRDRDTKRERERGREFLFTSKGTIYIVEGALVDMPICAR